MEGRNDNKEQQPGCGDVVGCLQEYLDGTLDKTDSLAVFLHLRDCEDCSREHLHMQELFAMLEALPAREVPAGFDEPIMEAIPLAAYRAMEPLRRERVPVYLETEFLPAWLRAPAVRLAGLTATLVGVGAVGFADAPSVVLVPAVAGAVPEIVVRLQALARRATLAVLRATN